MLSREQLKWTEKDTKIVDNYERALAEGKAEEIDFADVINDLKKY